MPSPKLNTRFISTRNWLSSNRWQALAFAFCVLFGAAMIANIELAGEATWFWYATLMHRGVKLYADMHLPLPPFYPLETDAWMILVGKRVLPYEALALIHVIVYCLGLLLVLRESTWPDWRKAPILAAGFFVDLYFVGLRFDDFHVVNDICVLFSIVALLRLYHANAERTQVKWAAIAGVICGVAFTNRAHDGAMLLAAVFICIPFLAKRRRLLSLALFLGMAALACLVIVHLTGDSFRDYASNSIFHAAAAKGGIGAVSKGPLTALLDNLHVLFHNKRPLWFLVVFAVGAIAKRFWSDDARSVISAEVLFCVIATIALVVLRVPRYMFLGNTFASTLNVNVQNVIYPLCLIVLVRFALAKWGKAHRPWDPREILIFIPAAVLVSAAASQANGSLNNTMTMTLFFLFATFWLPVAGRFRWLSDTCIVFAILLTANAAVYKYVEPYAWNFAYKPMFQGRELYHHPVYGPMYIQTDLLHFIAPICQEIHEHDPSPEPELLSLPYSYPNYFCSTPPWHNYVQTWFDTSTPETIEGLINELRQAPPKWIVYQQQLETLRNHEVIFNGGRPLVQRKLDELIMAKLADGEWKLIDRQNYLKGDVWYLIETRP